jgi:hypothetical protein
MTIELATTFAIEFPAKIEEELTTTFPIERATDVKLDVDDELLNWRRVELCVLFSVEFPTEKIEVLTTKLLPTARARAFRVTVPIARAVGVRFAIERVFDV